MDDEEKKPTEVEEEEELSEEEFEKLSHDEKIDIVAKRILKKHRRAFDELAKK